MKPSRLPKRKQANKSASEDMRSELEANFHALKGRYEELKEIPSFFTVSKEGVVTGKYWDYLKGKTDER